MLPIMSFKWKCPICDYEDEDRTEVMSHIKRLERRYKSSEISSDTSVAIRNRYPARTYSVARVKGWYYNSWHDKIYRLDRMLFFKDSDHFPEGEEGEVVSEYEIIPPNELGNYRFEQARCFVKDDLDTLLKEVRECLPSSNL